MVIPIYKVLPCFVLRTYVCTYVRVYVRTLVSGHIIGRAGASPPSRTSATEMFIYIYIIYDHLMCMREVYVKWFKGHHNRRYVSLLAMFT